MAVYKVFSMPFAKVYPLLIAKAERKGRTRDEVFSVTTWMTGYGVQVNAIEDPLTKDMRILDKLVDDLAKGKRIERITGQ